MTVHPNERHFQQVSIPEVGTPAAVQPAEAGIHPLHTRSRAGEALQHNHSVCEGTDGLRRLCGDKLPPGDAGKFILPPQKALQELIGEVSLICHVINQGR